MGSIKDVKHDQQSANLGTNTLVIEKISGVLRKVSVGNQTSVCDIFAVYLYKSGQQEGATSDRVIPEVLAMPIRQYTSADLELNLEGLWTLKADLRNCTALDVIELSCMVET